MGLCNLIVHTANMHKGKCISLMKKECHEATILQLAEVLYHMQITVQADQHRTHMVNMNVNKRVKKVANW